MVSVCISPASLKVENNFQVHHMYNALQPLLEDAERLVVACQQGILSTILGGKATMRGDTYFDMLDVRSSANLFASNPSIYIEHHRTM